MRRIIKVAVVAATALVITATAASANVGYEQPPRRGRGCLVSW